MLSAISVVESFFGALLNLPDAINALSPFWWAGNFPSTPLEPSRIFALGAAGTVLLALSIAGFGRRDLAMG